MSGAAGGRTDSDDGQALAALEAAGADDFTTTWSGHTGAIADLRMFEVPKGVGSVKGGVCRSRSEDGLAKNGC